MFIDTQYPKLNTLLPRETVDISKVKLGNWHKDVMLGLGRSIFFKAVPIGIVLVASALSVSFFVFRFSPAPWMYAAGGVSAYVLGILIQLPFGKGLAKLQHELSALVRHHKKEKQYDVIMGFRDGDVYRKIFLGPLPNRYTSNGEHLVQQEKIGAVLSINEPWECKAQGLALPYSQQDWAELGVDYLNINAEDHQPLTMEQMDNAAKWIHAQFAQGKNVYVHCRAGCGRSNLAMAAYLMRYHNFTPGQAASFIKTCHSVSTIKKDAKMKCLYDYANQL